MGRQPNHWQVTRKDVPYDGRIARNHRDIAFQVQTVVFADTEEEALAQGAALMQVSPDRLTAQRFVSGAPIGG